MRRRQRAIRGGLALASSLVLAVGLGACGGNADPYAVLDQARTASYDRVQLNVGFTLAVPAQTEGDGFQSSATNINVDPSWVTAAADFPDARFYLRLAVPVDQLGLPPQGLIGIPFASVDLEALMDGTDVYVKSPLLPLALQNGIGGAPVQGDLTGWVRFSGAGALGPMAPAMLGFPFLLGDAPDLVARLPLPSPGDAIALKQLLTAMGATVEYAGTESVEGVELIHLKGGLRVATLAASAPFLALTGMTRDQVQGLVDLEGEVGVSTEIWVNKATGRLATLRIDGTNADTPATTVAVIVRIADPGPGVTFEPPTTFTDIDVSDLIGDGLSGFGAVGGGGGTVEPMPTPQAEGEGAPENGQPTTR